MTSRRLLLTPARWAATSAAFGAVLAGAIWAFPSKIHGMELPVRRGPFELFAAVLACLVVFVMLSGEEARLQRELRTARAGSATARQIVLRRKRAAPWYARLTSTTLGLAAIYLADGDAEAGQAALRANPFTLGLGRLATLREVVHADVLRGVGAESTLGDAIRALYNMPPLANLEAERYRVHVLVKALLEQADGATARHLAHDLAESSDDEVRVYAVWLRAWFEPDQLSAADEAQVRLALLLARSHGAEDLARRLSEELAGRATSSDTAAVETSRV